METERRAMTLFRLLVETYLKRGGGDDWRFCLLAAWILSDIARNNATKGKPNLKQNLPKVIESKKALKLNYKDKGFKLNQVVCTTRRKSML